MSHPSDSARLAGSTATDHPTHDSGHRHDHGHRHDPSHANDSEHGHSHGHSHDHDREHAHDASSCACAELGAHGAT